VHWRVVTPANWGVENESVWLFQELLTRAVAIDVLFNRFNMILPTSDYLPMSGQILDATLVPALK